MPPIVLAVIQWMHVFCAIWWFGSILVSRVETWPAYRIVGPEIEAKMRAAERQASRGRLYTAIQSFGTIGLGILRGVLGGALGRFDEPYGWTWLAALILGLVMLGWLWLPIPDGRYTPLGRKLYVAAFPTIFTLMIAMRFGY